MGDESEAEVFARLPHGGTAAQAGEVEALLAAARQGAALGNPDILHLTSRAGLVNYARIADEIAARLAGRAAPLLDWGCGYGQMTYLLKNRGIDVTSYDIGDRPHRRELPVFGAIDVTYGDDPRRLPFDDAAFDAVLSCGVLEHVDDDASTAEIARVLRPGGLFFIYMLPNRFSLTELLATLRGISDHPRKYTVRGTRRLLRAHGLEPIAAARSNFLPKNLTGLPERLRRAYGRRAEAIVRWDGRLSAIPPLSWLSGVIEMTARKP